MGMRLLLLLTMPAISLIAASGADPAKAGMTPERPHRIPRMQVFVDKGTAAGFVTLTRHGQLASLEAVGYQAPIRSSRFQAAAVYTDDNGVLKHFTRDPFRRLQVSRSRRRHNRSGCLLPHDAQPRSTGPPPASLREWDTD